MTDMTPGGVVEAATPGSGGAGVGGSGEGPKTPVHPQRKCAVTGCEGVHYALGWCAFHHRRWTQSGAVDGRGHVGARPRAYSLTEQGRAVLAVPPQLLDAGYTVIALIPLTDLSALTGVQG